MHKSVNVWTVKNLFDDMPRRKSLYLKEVV